MRKERTLFLFGIWLMILPFLGFTVNIRKGLFVFTGLMISLISYLFYVEKKARIRNNKSSIERPAMDETESFIARPKSIRLSRKKTRENLNKEKFEIRDVYNNNENVNINHMNSNES